MSGPTEAAPETPAQWCPVESPARHATGVPLTKEEEHHWPVPWTPVEGKREGLGAWLEYLALRVFSKGVASLPPPFARPVMGGMARLLRRLDKRHADAARNYIKQALQHWQPESPPSTDDIEQMLLRCYRHLIEVSVRSPSWNPQLQAPDWRERIRCDISPEVEALRGKGAILVGPHVGNWEAGGGIMARLGFGPVYGVVKPPRNGPVSRHIQSLREGRGVRTLPRRGGIQHATTVVERGGLLVLILDQRARTKGVLAPFFGRPALCDRSAAVLIRRLKVPLIFGAVYSDNCPKDRNRYRTLVHARRVMQPEDFAGLGPVEILTRINQEMEQLIMKRPDQYLWLHDRYKGADEELKKQASD